jgi:hypothetical protein
MQRHLGSEVIEVAALTRKWASKATGAHAQEETAVAVSGSVEANCGTRPSAQVPTSACSDIEFTLNSAEFGLN